ncbi:hypothetical protein ACK389_10540 [Streptomyces antibioticus]|uniref:hypothetical protein n=1 Tax=Streptomyces TaxID=1883 RepID=UPI00167A3E11|nr:hypothetical protein [Streptomyces tanashiensis]GGT22346.1 hypothetical protein GCM10010222_75320 [Streptomyces tanashiensis]
MLNRSLSRSAYGTGWSSTRRALLIAAVLLTLIAVSGLAASLAGHGDRPSESPGSPAPSSPSSTPAPASSGRPAAGTGPVPAPPRIADPVAFAKRAAAMLWSYDTRDTSRDEQIVGMERWMTKESQYSDWLSVSAQVPDPTLWSRMADQQQRASAAMAEGHYPAAFKQALAEDPSAITKAYIYAVTVTGKQRITWAKGGGGAEDRSVTLAVQCRPSHDCSLVAIAPRIAP